MIDQQETISKTNARKKGRKDGNESNTTKKQGEEQKIVGTWNHEQIQKGIAVVESQLEDRDQSLSKSRKKLLYSKIVKLRKALKGERAVGGQKEAKKVNKTKIYKSRINNWSNQQPETRWKECLCCRGKGHTMQECRKNPDNKRAKENGEYVKSKRSFCFNCGQVDHTIWQCNEAKNEDGSLPFATCFLCGEKGHLSSKCSRNTTGIYPKGGGCHICSSLYHLMKDCPSKPNHENLGSEKNKLNNKKSFSNQLNYDKQEDSSKPVSWKDEDNDSYWM